MESTVNNGRAMNFLPAFKDVEDIHHMVDLLKSKKYPAILDLGLTGTLIINLLEDNFIYQSPEIKKILGFALENNYKEFINKILPSEDRIFFKELFSQFVTRLQKPVPFECKKWLTMGELRIVCKDKEKWLRYRIIVLPKKIPVEEVFLVLFITDISMLTHGNTLSWYLYNTQTHQLLEKKTKIAFPLKMEKQKERLTHRELEIIKLISDGLTNKEISAKLYVSNNTIKTHRQHIYEKLCVKKSSEMVKVCICQGII